MSKNEVQEQLNSLKRSIHEAISIYEQILVEVNAAAQLAIERGTVELPSNVTTAEEFVRWAKQDKYLC